MKGLFKIWLSLLKSHEYPKITFSSRNVKQIESARGLLGKIVQKMQTSYIREAKMLNVILDCTYAN